MCNAARRFHLCDADGNVPAFAHGYFADSPFHAEFLPTVSRSETQHNLRRLTKFYNAEVRLGEVPWSSDSKMHDSDSSREKGQTKYLLGGAFSTWYVQILRGRDR